MPIIRPLEDLTECAQISRLCHEQDEPVFFTQSGSGHVVMMSMEVYQRQMGLVKVYQRLEAARRQVEEGLPLSDAQEVVGRLRAKHGQ